MGKDNGYGIERALFCRCEQSPYRRMSVYIDTVLTDVADTATLGRSALNLEPMLQCNGLILSTGLGSMNEPIPVLF